MTPLFRSGLTDAESNMIINVRSVGKATILDLRGRLILGDAVQSFRDSVQDVLDAGSKNLAINLAGVKDMDSSGIGALVRVFAAVTRSGGKCAFFAPTKLVRQSLTMVCLDSVLELAEDEQSALSVF